MGQPQFVPQSPTDKPHVYRSPDHVPGPWTPDRPADLDGRQPAGPSLGYQGPDQGFGIVLANRFRDRLHVQSGVSVDDAVQGCLGVALRRASMFGRAPTVHDFTVAFTVYGFLDPSPPAALAELRGRMFPGVTNVSHHYVENRAIVDLVPEATLRRPHQQVVADYPSKWSALLGTAA